MALPFVSRHVVVEGMAILCTCGGGGGGSGGGGGGGTSLNSSKSLVQVLPGWLNIYRIGSNMFKK